MILDSLFGNFVVLGNNKKGAYLNYNGSIFVIIEYGKKIVLNILAFNNNMIIKEFIQTIKYIMKNYH